MVSGVVMSNNRRRLDPAEFRGFARSDRLAPLTFINGVGTNAARRPGFRRDEVWCNAVAAEFLVPLTALRSALEEDELLPDALSRLVRTFRVSTLVILRRLLAANWMTRDRFDAAWAEDSESERLRTLAQGASDGGNFYRTTLARVSRRFARALVVSTLEGQTLYRYAFGMLGVSETKTLNSLGREIGVMG